MPDHLRIDGNQKPALPPRCAAVVETLVGGDDICPAIGAASILAKVARDDLMRELHRTYPDYGFNQHMGYPTAFHREALLTFGPTPEHRLSFRPVREAAEYFRTHRRRSPEATRLSFTFVHLRVHSEYSIADSIIRIPEFVQAVADASMPAVALTDQGNLFALVKYYKAALAAGVKPIIGADVQIEAAETKAGYAPVILLARNAVGYLNLKRLITSSFVTGQRNGVPVINEEWLTADSAEWAYCFVRR